MSGSNSDVTITSVEIGFGAVCNLLLVFALAHTWKHWRQVKLFVVMLTVGNILEVGFTMGLYLGWMKTNTWTSTAAACKFLVFMSTLGPSLANMSLAALAVHVLLTSITGNQGNGLRQGMVIALFTVLSLPLPLSQIPMYDVRTFYGGMTVCGNFMLETQEQMMYYQIGLTVALDFFPLFVLIVASAAAAVFNFRGGQDKSDVRWTDLVLTLILGLVMLICSLPKASIDLYMATGDNMSVEFTVEIFKSLMYLWFARAILTAVVCVVFGYVHAFRNRGQGYSPMGGEHRASGERQKLVN